MIFALSALLFLFVGGKIAVYKTTKLCEGLETRESILRTYIVEFINNQVAFDYSPIPDVELMDHDGHLIGLSEILHEERLIIYLPDIGCHTCSDKEVELVKSIFLNEAKNKIWVIAKFNNKRELQLFESQSGLIVYGIDSQCEFPSEKLALSPVLFLLSQDQIGFAFFKPVKEMSQFSILYYKAVLKRLNQK